MICISDSIYDVLCFLLCESGSRIPSSARLLDMRKLLFAAKDYAPMTFYVDALGVHRYHGCIIAAARIGPVALLEVLDVALPVLC
ncbi:hypothetical protein QN364_19995, partial [Undibacterium sp. CCC1.1]|nr:hypothetical protein [Undibacterium sp. CCC1.1]